MRQPAVARTARMQIRALAVKAKGTPVAQSGQAVRAKISAAAAAADIGRCLSCDRLGASKHLPAAIEVPRRGLEVRQRLGGSQKQIVICSILTTLF